MNNAKYLEDFSNTDWGPYLDSAGAPNRGPLTPYLRFIWWVKRATELFDNKFQYDHTTWVNGNSKTSVTCPIHGQYMVNARAHLNSKGCPSCVKRLPANGSTVSYWKSRLKSFENANPNVIIHWPVLPIYSGRTEISYTCTIHGIVHTTIDSLYKSKRCKHCSYANTGLIKRNNISKLIEFLKDKRIKLVEDTYISYMHNATFLCEEHNIEFESKPTNIVYGITKYGCKACNAKYKNTGTLDEQEFKKEFSDKLAQRKIEIFSFNKSTDITFKCLECDLIWKANKSHVCGEGTGCPDCAHTGNTSVYLFKDQELGIYKIGIAKNVSSRMKRLNKFFDFVCIKSKNFESRREAFELEQKLHKLFDCARFSELDDTNTDGKTELFELDAQLLEKALTYYD